jgi:hypothetical protein
MSFGRGGGVSAVFGCCGGDGASAVSRGGTAAAAGGAATVGLAGAGAGVPAPSGIARHLWSHFVHFTVRPLVPKASALTLKRAEHDGQLSIMLDRRSEFLDL